MQAAVIGTGRMGRRHIAVLRQMGVTIAGICDSSAEALAAARDEHSLGDDQLFTEAGQLLERFRPECVIIATTADTHARYTCMAADAGARFILCEKPMATSIADCDRMIDACHAAGARLAINHQRRYMPQYRVARAATDADAFGGMRSMTVIAGNMGLAMNATHYFEIFNHWTGERPTEVCGWFTDLCVSNPRGAQFQDAAGAVRLVTPSGRRLYIEAGPDQGHGLHVVYAGPRGLVTVDELLGTMRSSTRAAEHAGLPTTRYGMPSDDTCTTIPAGDLLASTRMLLESLFAGGDVPSAADGRLAVQCLVAAYASNETGHIPVTLEGALRLRDHHFPWA